MRSTGTWQPAVPIEPADPLLSIGAFARRSRLSTKALRLYDRLGLLTPAHVDHQTGYRRYRESQLSTARLVVMLRRLDMPLTTVAEVVSAAGTDGAEIVASYWTSVERRVASQRELAAHLRIRLSGQEGGLEVFEVHEGDVPEQVVLTEQRHVQVGELSDWLLDARDRLLNSAENYGGPAGATFVVYYGEVNDDSDGPVEVCVPLHADEDVWAGSAVRREPAHREAYVTLTKAQVEYPQILSAYDAVGRWVTANGFHTTGSPREVYFGDWDHAGPADEVCDVAAPMR